VLTGVGSETSTHFEPAVSKSAQVQALENREDIHAAEARRESVRILAHPDVLIGVDGEVRIRTSTPDLADQPSVLLQFLSEHDDDAAGTADVREPIDVLIGRHTAKRTAAVFRGYLKGLVQIID
jgi:hypothetical protein